MEGLGKVRENTEKVSMKHINGGTLSHLLSITSIHSCLQNSMLSTHSPGEDIAQHYPSNATKSSDGQPLRSNDSRL